MYITRSYLGKALIPGYVRIMKLEKISPPGKSNEKKECEVLCNASGSWVEAEDGTIPPWAFPAGTNETGEILYIGRVVHADDSSNGYLIGSVQKSKKCCFYYFQNKEYSSRKYQIFVCDQVCDAHHDIVRLRSERVKSERVNNQNFRDFRGIDTYPLNVKDVDAYILNNVTFNNVKLTKRLGSDNDAKKLEETFGSFQIAVQTHRNPSLSEIREIVSNIRDNKTFNPGGCLIFCILSHGSKGNQIHAFDLPYNLHEDVIKPIVENESLRGKPKVFIIQACRGDIESDSIQWSEELADQTPDGSDFYMMNRDADLLILCASFPGTVSWRHKHNGSYFIQTLCRHIQEQGDIMDLEDIMCLTTSDVMKMMHMEIGTQTPTKHSSMTKKFILRDNQP